MLLIATQTHNTVLSLTTSTLKYIVLGSERNKRGIYLHRWPGRSKKWPNSTSPGLRRVKVKLLKWERSGSTMPCALQEEVSECQDFCWRKGFSYPKHASGCISQQIIAMCHGKNTVAEKLGKLWKGQKWEVFCRREQPEVVLRHSFQIKCGFHEWTNYTSNICV